MKKTLKIIGITLGSIVGIVVTVAAVAVWCVFTPARITPVVRSIADQYITCEWDMGEVELTFFSTFPEFGLKVNNLYLVNPMPEAQSDTVLATPSLVAKLNVMEYIRHNNLVIRELSMKDMSANLFIDTGGVCNANVFYTTPDTAVQDTSAFQLPFDSIVVNGCVFKANRLTFVDRKDSIEAALNATSLDLKMAYWDDIRLLSQLNIEHVAIKGVQYAHNATLSLDIPAEMDLQTMHFVLHEAEVSVNDFAMTIDGNATLGDTIPMDVTIDTHDWQIVPLLAMLPKSIRSQLKDIDIDGLLSLHATAQGIYAAGVMPIIDAHVLLQEGKGRYMPLPYTFNQLALEADAHMDMNTPSQSRVVISQLKATTLNSTVQLSGTIDDVMGQLRTQAHVNIDVALPDWAYFMPQTIQMDGKVKGGLNLRATLGELMKQQMNSVAVDGQIEVTGLDLRMDSMAGQMDEAAIQVKATMRDWPRIDADIALQSKSQLHVVADSLQGILTAPNLTVQAQMDIQDTTSLPTVKAHITWQELDGVYKDYKGHIGYSQLDANIKEVGHSHSLPTFSGVLSSHDIDAQAMGNHIVAKDIDLDVKSIYNKKGENLLLTWNPMMKFALNGAEVDLKDFEKHISIPQIAFNYSNRDFNILSSSIILGQSDFSLTGDIHKIGKWMAKEDVLTGELNFVSNHTDVNELLALFSADTGSEETTTTTTTTTTTEADSTSGPFLVPSDVDLTLNTTIKEAVVMNQVAKNLGGKVYVRNGTLVLEEVGFVCDAAKLQLTAMYRTPRRNHIYVGLDYHMLDVKIDQLISMIPQIDSMVPMLRSFKGEAEFHLAGETYLNGKYQIKTSTLRGACSLFGKDLVVLDSETFDKISKMLSFKKKTENRVDSISAEITLYKNEVDIYPFCVSMDHYMAAMGGRHNLDMSFDYHINLLSPIYIGVDINGTLDNLTIKPAKCIYAKDFKPILHKNVDSQNAELRKIIRNNLRKNVKIQ